MDRLTIYDIIYALAARDGREAALFGNCSGLAHEAVARGLAGEVFPEIWLEVPLMGEPWFDAHVNIDHVAVAGTPAAFPGHGGAYNDAMRWFASRQEGVRQLVLSYDSHSGDIDHPALQLLVAREGSDVVAGFMESVGLPEVTQVFRDFVSRMPDDWYACYLGLFPQRAQQANAPYLRLECIAGDKLQRMYAQDPATLQQHLQDVGVGAGDGSLVQRCCELAASPFPLEFQFDVMQDGRAGTTVSASVRFQPTDWMDPERYAQIDGLFERLVDWGLADERWRLLERTAIAQRIAHEGEAVRAFCFPAFIKLRWRDGKPLDAKTYLDITVRE